MILLTPEAERADAAPVVAVFGAGLIGTAFSESVTSALALRRRSLPLSWHQPTAQREELGVIEEEVVAACCAWPPADPPRRLLILWSAGSAGFQATAALVDRELASFEAVLESTNRVARRLPQATVAFGLISSAGGLFEGQRSVGPEAKPEPKRPYGELKLQQEGLLAKRADRLVTRVYRLTSVYGHLAPGRRRGLIPTLILDGLRRQVTRITGRMDTLRDFIWVEDVSSFVLSDLLNATVHSGASPMILASSKPSSIHEVQQLVERILGHKLYVSYSCGAPNSEDITFSSGAAARGWLSSDLASNVRQIYLRALCRGTGEAVFAA